jgi:hypothetical protein
MFGLYDIFFTPLPIYNVYYLSESFDYFAGLKDLENMPQVRIL